MKETLQQRRYRAKKIYRTLEKLYPDAKMALKWKTPIQLLVAVMLSAQCTDKKVNEVTEPLFKKYKTVDDFASADSQKLEREIRPTGLYRAKARNIIAAAKMIRQEFRGKLPKTMDNAVRLPGVARKTANVMLGNAYHIVEGIAVDTHVQRLAQRLELTEHTDPTKIEQDLMRLFPKSHWFNLSYLLIGHGRAVCKATYHPACRVLPYAVLRHDTQTVRKRHLLAFHGVHS